MTELAVPFNNDPHTFKLFCSVGSPFIMMTTHILDFSVLWTLRPTSTGPIFPGYCIEPDRRAGDDLPDEDDFITALFQEFSGHGTCTLDEHGNENESLLS